LRCFVIGVQFYPDCFPKVVRAESEAEKLRKKVKYLEDQLGVERAEGEIVAVETQDTAEAVPTTLDFPPEQQKVW